MENKLNKNINRRNFLKVVGGTALASAAVLPGCKNRQEAAHTATTEVPTDQMTYRTNPCNDCKYCMPCPYGLDIPAILLHYNKCINEGNVPASSQDENYRKARRAFLIGYDRSVPKLRQANHCIGCGQCVSHCPQSINIPKELHRIDRFVEELKQGKEF